MQSCEAESEYLPLLYDYEIMSHAAAMGSIVCLRAAVHQLTNTPTKDLPFLASYLASAIGDCAAVLSVSDNGKTSGGDQDASVLVQKLKARITSLLQDRTVEGRWTATVLVKSIIEAGQWEILRACEPWVRGLMGILNVSASWSLVALPTAFVQISC